MTSTAGTEREEVSGAGGVGGERGRAQAVFRVPEGHVGAAGHPEFLPWEGAHS